MAEREGANARSIQQNGEYGNACIAHLQDTLADSANDTIVLGKLPGGCTLTGSRLIAADLGTGCTLDIGWRYITAGDGTSDLDGLFDGIDVATAVSNSVFAGAPVSIAEGDGVEIVATALGAAVAGAVDVVVDYIYNGNG